MTLDDSSSLADRLAKDLPESCRFTIHHLSTPPTQSHPLYAAPPGELAEETYCESHFLSVSIDLDGRQLQVYAVEVLIFSTEFLTTLFVSKADSTGYLYLLETPSGTPSPFKLISTTFLRYLVENRRRTDRRLVLSLFARAQNQYLFPGSIENSHKHVLDHRGLIKWWCKVVDPILASYKNKSEGPANKCIEHVNKEVEILSQGFLRVPGCDEYGTQSFLPRDKQGRKPENHRWKTSDPLCELGKPPNIPERCLIPRFPDDPKARFVEQLDEELPDQDGHSSPSLSQDAVGPPKKQKIGRWRSVRSLEQFWDMMSFRQECSSGRLVGFLWAVFHPDNLVGVEKAVGDEELSRSPEFAQSTAPGSVDQESALLPPQSPLRSDSTLQMPSTPSKENISISQQTSASTPQKTKEADIRNLPEETKYYYWPKSSRGQIVLRQKDYQRASKLLLCLDYANQEVATDSTRRWVNDVAAKAGISTWGQTVVGTVRTAPRVVMNGVGENPTMLNANLIRKKKRPLDELNGHGAKSPQIEINTLSTDLARKKTKVADSAAQTRVGGSDGG